MALREVLQPDEARAEITWTALTPRGKPADVAATSPRTYAANAPRSRHSLLLIANLHLVVSLFQVRSVLVSDLLCNQYWRSMTKEVELAA